MADTSGSGSGGGTGWFGTILQDATQVGMSYAAAKALDVNGNSPETVPGVENGYYGYGGAMSGAPASSGTSLGMIALVGVLAVLGFLAVKHLR